MKKILITGANSYVGTHVEAWLMKEPDKYLVDTLDMKDPNWINHDFSKYDVVFHVAGIAHKRIKKRDSKIYYNINHDLAVKVADNANSSGVKHFILVSSMAVYGNEIKKIDSTTIPKPKTDYGKSKFLAEQDIKLRFKNRMIISILRPPLIYGYNSPGNFAKLSNITKRLKIYSSFRNKRSMIFIDNFSNLIRIIIDRQLKGIFHPQNSEFVSTMDCCKMILEVNGLNHYRVNILNIFLLVFSRNVLKKSFGDLYYNQLISGFDLNYNIVDFKKSITLSEGGSL